eukprot:CAMPEP_0201568104 /NCGR_PEP_ID=MMETSP0190_2-20130828/8976_1 /ASSEMBLY_ACC=CAM_ASM_000263 /TAXON_ID=37353 /ORGANISM="Rosalina sp." /LENGTH=80 /DNA_ID=CAMNT_0047988841 /DNA_START=45 /DNA_END=284 /DNA_ORIENTATION=+
MAEEQLAEIIVSGQQSNEQEAEEEKVADSGGDEGIGSIANSNGGINEAMNVAADAVDISDKDVKKGIDLMIKNWNKINSK